MSETLRINQWRINSEFKKRLLELTGEDVISCFQCGKCTSSCPMTHAMDLMPNQIIRFAQLGDEETVMRSQSIYVCASCLQCQARCPKEISIARVAEGIRILAIGKGIEPYHPNLVPPELLRSAPQQGFVSAFRKYSS